MLLRKCCRVFSYRQWKSNIELLLCMRRLITHHVILHAKILNYTELLRYTEVLKYTEMLKYIEMLKCTGMSKYTEMLKCLRHWNAETQKCCKLYDA